MRISIPYGLEQAVFEAADVKVIGDVAVAARGTANPIEGVRAALEEPIGFPALRRALTPDDHVAVVVDESLPRVAELLIPILEHITSAGVSAAAITVISPPHASNQPWLDGLPAAFSDVRLEVHDPRDRNKLSYLATTKKGRRIYLNRTVVDADQVVVLSGRRYDLVLGRAGAEGSLFPYLSDEATRKEVGRRISFDPPTEEPWPVNEEAIEAAWLLGAPFFIQVIEAAGDGIDSVLAGSVEASLEGIRRQDACWRLSVPRAADLVVASVSGDPARHTFADLAAALACASRVVSPEGRIVLLSQANPPLGPGMDAIRGCDNPREALKDLSKEADVALVPAMQWARAACQAHINLLSGLPAETVEELQATPLENVQQVSRLLDACKSCLFLPDAHKALAVLGEDA